MIIVIVVVIDFDCCPLFGPRISAMRRLDWHESSRSSTGTTSPASMRPCKHFPLVSPRRLSPLRSPPRVRDESAHQAQDAASTSPKSIISPLLQAMSPLRAVSPIVRALSPLRAGVNAVAAAATSANVRMSKADRLAEKMRLQAREEERTRSIIAMLAECKPERARFCRMRFCLPCSAFRRSAACACFSFHALCLLPRAPSQTRWRSWPLNLHVRSSLRLS